MKLTKEKVRSVQVRLVPCIGGNGIKGEKSLSFSVYDATPDDLVAIFKSAIEKKSK